SSTGQLIAPGTWSSANSAGERVSRIASKSRSDAASMGTLVRRAGLMNVILRPAPQGFAQDPGECGTFRRRREQPAPRRHRAFQPGREVSVRDAFSNQAGKSRLVGQREVAGI